MQSQPNKEQRLVPALLFFFKKDLSVYSQIIKHIIHHRKHRVKVDGLTRPHRKYNLPEPRNYRANENTVFLFLIQVKFRTKYLLVGNGTDISSLSVLLFNNQLTRDPQG